MKFVYLKYSKTFYSIPNILVMLSKLNLQFLFGLLICIMIPILLLNIPKVIPSFLSFAIGFLCALFMLMLLFFFRHRIIKWLGGEQVKLEEETESTENTRETLQCLGEAALDIALERLPDEKRKTLKAKGPKIVSLAVNSYMRKRLESALTTVFVAVGGLEGTLASVNQKISNTKNIAGYPELLSA